MSSALRTSCTLCTPIALHTSTSSLSLTPPQCLHTQPSKFRLHHHDTACAHNIELHLIREASQMSICTSKSSRYVVRHLVFMLTSFGRLAPHSRTFWIGQPSALVYRPSLQAPGTLNLPCHHGSSVGTRQMSRTSCRSVSIVVVVPRVACSCSAAWWPPKRWIRVIAGLQHDQALNILTTPYTIHRAFCAPSAPTLLFLLLYFYCVTQSHSASSN